MIYIYIYSLLHIILRRKIKRFSLLYFITAIILAVKIRMLTAIDRRTSMLRIKDAYKLTINSQFFIIHVLLMCIILLVSENCIRIAQTLIWYLLFQTNFPLQDQLLVIGISLTYLIFWCYMLTLSLFEKDIFKIFICMLNLISFVKEDAYLEIRRIRFSFLKIEPRVIQIIAKLDLIKLRMKKKGQK